MRQAAPLLAPLLALACASANPTSSAKPAENSPTPARADKPAPEPAPRPPAFTMTKAMVPMRDGVKLETVIFSPVDAKKPLPVLFLRSPYGIPEDASVLENPGVDALRADGYIIAAQNCRGRFGSEGTFVISPPPHDPADPRGVDDATDAHDSIEWFVKNVPGNNGRVGMMGTSYGAWTATMALLEPHPALRVIVEEASPADEFTGDDFRHNGAFRLAYGFEYVARMETSKEANTVFSYGRSDLYDFFLDLGPLANADARHFHGKMPTWNDFVAHPNLDAFLERRAIVSHLRKATIPILNVAGWWDQEDFYGPFGIYATLEKSDAARKNHLVVGPWNHGGWGSPGRKLGPVDFGSDTGVHYRDKIVVPWLAHWLHDKPTEDQPEATIFETGTNRWRTFDRWPPEAGVTKKKLYLRAGRALSFEPPTETGRGAVDSYVSDPQNPVPFVSRPIQPLLTGSQWQTWMVQDQRFVDHRPDVLSFSTGPLDADLTVAGDIVAELFASTSGTDSDWIVKLIDVYPEGDPKPPPEAQADGEKNAEPAADMRGYQLMVASRVLRGRFRDSFAKPAPIPPGKVLRYAIDLETRAHTFRKGHRIMVQVQSTWFPVIDRNPQRYVDSIFAAKESDYVAATQTIARSREAPSAIVLPVLSP
ncbi:CocE/NonD family hydrolase [Polyangium mundeleinium]|uniref:CocE/NonD family hydrolase n=1 Tax=Polyangium mundeleinium TaxID=2995306 RepID=A0ABT5F3I3_9BACT|nr:CocE/NonD family hydrolase [Polyangium mundeleinium]MDC0748648.1 CocE/NonD family hydrolase [Polyangium mundeleinium]